ncbi:MAG: hypothetical protein EBZ47_04215 [Chlamydiae bacterium]|nr:hypothetical protein [Chlamydiota bacterium]
MKRFEVLNPQTPIFGKFLLEASAGTGKTFAIEHIVVRALLQSKEPLTIDRILIVTFTRAATRELKVRLRSNLTKTLLYLQRGSGGPDYLRTIFDQGSSAIFSAQRIIEEALCNFDKSSIFTLHGFCHKMLTEFAFEAGTFFDITPPEGMTHTLKIRQVVEDFLLSGLSSYLYSPGQLGKLFSYTASSFESFVNKIVSWVERDVHIPQEKGFQENLIDLERELSNISENEHLLEANYLADVDLLFGCYKKIKEEHQTQAHQFFYILTSKKFTYEQLDEIISNKDYFLSLLRSDNLKKGKEIKILSLNYPSLWNDLIEKIFPTIQHVADADITTLRLIKDAIATWKKSFYYQESFSPDDLLKKMKDAMQNSSFKQKLLDKFVLGIIDEFQDTDPMQWDIFKALFLDNEKSSRTIYLVGDPKQSIYSFRNADVYTYLQAMKDLGEENRLFLDINYRSDPSLVHALNILFTQNISNQWMQLPLLGNALEVRSVGAKAEVPSIQNDSEIKDVHFFIAEGYSGKSKKWPTEEVEDKQLFPFIVSQIKKMHYEKKHSFKQFAILVKDRFQSLRVESFLKEHGIPCSVKRTFSLEQSAGFIAMYDLLKAVINPEDLVALKRVLGGVFLRLNAQQISTSHETSLLSFARLYFQKAKVYVQQKGWGAFFSYFLSTTWYKKEKTIMVQQADGVNGFSVDEIHHFLSHLPLMNDEDEILKIASETEEDQVTIMTIHASKGLEFDFVFPIGVVARHSVHEDVIRTKHETISSLEKWDLKKPSCLLSVLETDAEKMRHLYVALTRAKSKVFIPMAIDLDQKEVVLSSASPIELFTQGFGADGFDVVKIYQDIHKCSLETICSHLDDLSSEASIGYTLLAKNPIQLSSMYASSLEKELVFPAAFSKQFSQKQVISFTSLQKESASEQEAVFLPIGEEERKLIFPLGAQTGTFMHRVIELSIKEGLHCPFDRKAIAELVLEHAQGTSMEAFSSEAVDLIEKVFHTRLIEGSKTFCLADIPQDNFFLEMEFAFEWHGDMMKGFIDAVFFHNKKYYIIDWKTNFLGLDPKDYNETSVAQSMEDHGYSLQAAIYGEALRRYLSCGEKERFTSLFGGAFYVFLRGPFFYHFPVNLDLLIHRSKK